MSPPDREPRQAVVLIADDDELMRSLLSAALTEKGFDTMEVADGREAVSAVQRACPDIVLLDVEMPGMNGYEACEAIRLTENGRELPIVIITGNEDTDSIDRAFDCGATDFISKPVNWSLIGYRMRYVLRGARLRSELITSEARNRAMLEALPDRLLLVSGTGRILTVIEQSRSQPDGLVEPDDLSGAPIDRVFPSDIADSAISHLQNTLANRKASGFEFSLPGNGDSARTDYEVRILPQAADVALLIVRDVSERKRTEEQIHHLAYFDSLTSLPNRHDFMRRAEAKLAESTGRSHLLCYFNLDHFKRINDTLGHASGDNALVEIARRLIGFRDRWRELGYDLDIARLGSDEFALLIELREAQDQLRMLSALRSEFEVPINCDRHQLVVTISAGSALYPADASDMETLMRNADKAMSSAKQAGRNTFVQYSRRQHETQSNVLQLESDLRQAIEREELQLYFQPKYDLRSGELTGAEALLRWVHGKQGMITPDTFIPIAEETGLIVDIDRWVIDRACFHLRGWRSRGLDPVPISINLSGREFCFDQPEVALQRAMHTHGIDPGLLEIEITETVLMADPVTATRTLNKLTAMGIRLAVDDFGTGYSSLGYLKHFPLNVLKIDRSFVSELEEDSNDRALCRAMISMARGLGLEVVAEGIETEDQRRFLRYEGCQIGQGYLFSRPVPVDSYEKLLTERRFSPALETDARRRLPEVIDFRRS